MTTNNPKPANFINDDIDNEIRKIVKEIGVQNIEDSIEQHLVGIKNLLQQSQYKESYPNIRLLFESQEGFDALKDVLLFEKNRTLGKTTQENINVSSAMEVLKNIFIDNNSEALKIQKNITNIDQSIKLKKGQSEESEAEFKKRLKEESRANPIIKLLRLLFKKVTNKIFEEIKKEQLGKSREELNSLKGEFHKIVDSFNKELNDLMDAYGKGIESSTAYITPDPNYATIEEIFPKQKQQSVQQELPQSNNEPIYVSAEEVRQLKKQQKAAVEGSKVEYQVVHHSSQYFQVYDLPKPQRAQISEKPQIAPKPNLKNRFDAKGDGLQPADSVKDMAKKFEAKDQEKKAPVQNIIKQMRVKEEIKSSGLGNTQELAKRLGTSKPNKLIIPEGFKRELEKITTTPSPSSSPTSTKKSFFAIFKSDDVQNKASKIQETKQSTFHSTVSKGIPAPPPLPTQDDLKKAKLTSGKERDMTSQINPKKHATIQNKSIKTMNLDDLNKNPLYQKIKASNEKDEPQTKLTNSKTKDEQHTPIIGR